MALPVIKLGSLLVRTISKPIANRLKRAAADHPTFRGLIVDLAQVFFVFLIVMAEIKDMLMEYLLIN